MQHVHVAAEEFVFEASAGCGVHAIDADAVPPHFFTRLNQRELAADEVDAGIPFRCPDAEPPLGPLADAARSHVCDAAVLEFEPGVHHVFVAAEYRDADRRDVPYWATDQGQEQIEIVNHEVEDGTDVRAAAGEGPVAFGFDELGSDRPPREFFKGGIEPLDVPDL